MKKNTLMNLLFIIGVFLMIIGIINRIESGFDGFSWGSIIFVLGGILIGFGISLYKKISSSIKEEAKIKAEEEARIKAEKKARIKAEKKAEEEARIKAEKLKYIELYGEKFADAILQSNIIIGMPKEMVIKSIGKPDDIKQDVQKEKTKEEWFYGEYQTNRGNSKYKKRLNFENDLLVGWKDL